MDINFILSCPFTWMALVLVSVGLLLAWINRRQIVRWLANRREEHAQSQCDALELRRKRDLHDIRLKYLLERSEKGLSGDMLAVADAIHITRVDRLSEQYRLEVQNLYNRLSD